MTVKKETATDLRSMAAKETNLAPSVSHIAQLAAILGWRALNNEESWIREALPRARRHIVPPSVYDGSSDPYEALIDFLWFAGESDPICRPLHLRTIVGRDLQRSLKQASKRWYRSRGNSASEATDLAWWANVGSGPRGLLGGRAVLGDICLVIDRPCSHNACEHVQRPHGYASPQHCRRAV